MFDVLWEREAGLRTDTSSGPLSGSCPGEFTVQREEHLPEAAGGGCHGGALPDGCLVAGVGATYALPVHREDLNAPSDQRKVADL